MITIPTLKELYDSIIADIESEYGDSVPTFGKVVLRVMAAVQAAKLKLFYLQLGKIQKNIFVDTADPEAGGGTLERFGRIKLGRNPFSAVAGQYTIEVTGSIGAVISADQTFKSDDDSSSPGMLYILDTAHVMIATTDSITVRALNAGLDSRLAVGDGLTATSPITNVNAEATVLSEYVEPQAAEDTEEYREKAIDAYQLEPQGGAATDYRLWAADAQGVEQTYPYAKSGAAGDINLFVEATIADSTDGKGTPSASLLSRVEEVIEFDPDTSRPQSERGRRPLGVNEVHVMAVTIKEIDITIPSYVNLTVDIENEITNALEEMVNAIRPFVDACDVVAERNNVLDTNKIISTILLTTPGASFGTVTLSVGGTSLSTYTFTDGNIPHFNSVSFT